MGMTHRRDGVEALLIGHHEHDVGFCHGRFVLGGVLVRRKYV
jgi:hypothetical protein